MWCLGAWNSYNVSFYLSQHYLPVTLDFLLAIDIFVIATKSSLTIALESLHGADPTILSIKLTTKLMSFTTALKAFGEIELICKFQEKAKHQTTFHDRYFST